MACISDIEDVVMDSGIDGIRHVMPRIPIVHVRRNLCVLFVFIEGVKYFLVLILLLHSAVLNAAELVCSGIVDELSYHASNRFMLRLSSMDVAVFSVMRNGWSQAPAIKQVPMPAR
jgi:hypothetical protein